MVSVRCRRLGLRSCFRRTFLLRACSGWRFLGPCVGGILCICRRVVRTCERRGVPAVRGLCGPYPRRPGTLVAGSSMSQSDAPSLAEDDVGASRALGFFAEFACAFAFVYAVAFDWSHVISIKKAGDMPA